MSNGSQVLQDTPQSQVCEQLSQLGQQVERIDHLESEIRERLGDVLRAELTPAEEVAKQLEKSLVPLADRVRSMKNSISRSGDELERMLQCIEV